jgi:hypothetical protein
LNASQNKVGVPVGLSVMPPLIPPAPVGATAPPAPALAAGAAVPAVAVDGGAAVPAVVALVPLPAVVAGGFTAPVPATATEPGDPAVAFGGVLPVGVLGVVGAELLPAVAGVTLVSDSVFEGSSPPQPAPSQSRALHTSDLRARVVMASLLVFSIHSRDPRRGRRASVSQAHCEVLAVRISEPGLCKVRLVLPDLRRATPSHAQRLAHPRPRAES